MILNLGCGNDFSLGDVFMDKYPAKTGVIKCDFDKEVLPFKSNTFWLVYSKNLFEHLTNLTFSLNEMKRVTKKNGFVVVITDNANYWAYAKENGVHTGNYKGYGKNDSHFALFTDTHLRNIFEKAGLKVIFLRYVEQNHGLIGGIFFWFLKKTDFSRFAFSRVMIIGKKI